MFKNLLLLAVFSVTSFTCIAQKNKDKALDRMAQYVCQCIDSQGDALENISQNEFFLAVGSCLFKAHGEDPDFYNKAGISINSNDEKMEALGQEVGIKMATHCPDILMSLANHFSDDEEEDVQEKFTLKGSIEQVDQGTFNVLIIKGDDNRTYKMLWLTYVTNHDLLLEAVKDKKTYTITYYEAEVYDNRINEYRDMFVIDAIEK